MARSTRIRRLLDHRRDLQRMDPDILEKYHSQAEPYSTGSSSSHPRRIGGGTRVRSRLQGSIWITVWRVLVSFFSLLYVLGFVLIRVQFESLYFELESVTGGGKTCWRHEQEEPTSIFQDSMSCHDMPCHHAMSSWHVTKPRQYGCQIEAYFMPKPSGTLSSYRRYHIIRNQILYGVEFKLEPK